MGTRGATLVALLSVALMTGGCQVVGLLPLYLGTEQSGIAPPATESGLCLGLRVAPQDGQATDGTVMDQVQAVVGERVSMTGRVHGGLARREEPLATMDLLIAATALTHEAALLTGNEAHLARVSGLRVVGYR